MSIRWGKRLGLVQNSWNCHCWLPSVFEPPKPIRGTSWAFHAPCFLWPQVFSLLLLLTGFCFHSPSEHMGCAHGPWEHNSCGSEGGHTSLPPCGFLHISAHQCVWGQCLAHNEMTFPWACKTDASRSEISWTPVSKPAGRAGVAQSLTCVTVAGSLAPCPGGKAPIPTYLIFSFLALCQIFFVLF